MDPTFYSPPPSLSLQLPKDQCTESFEKSILRLLNQGDHSESRDVEKNLRYVTVCPDIHLMCQVMGYGVFSRLITDVL